jgi:Phage terminase large subunit
MPTIAVPEGENVIRYDPNPSGVAIHDCDAKIKCVIGPVGSGKTSIGCWEFFLLCMESKVPIRAVVIRESYRELQDSTRATFMEWFQDIAEYREKDEKALVTLTGKDGVERTHEMFFRACRKESEASKFLSTEFAMAWLEEVSPAYTKRGVMGQGLPQGVFDIAKMRIRQKGVPRLLILLTANPPNTRHWLYKEFFLSSPEEMTRKKYALFRQPAMENKHNLPEDYYEDLLETLSPDMARRFVGGEVVPIYDGVRVFPECVDNYHIVEHVEPIPGVALVLGQDYGLTPCTLITQIVPGGQWRWLKELQVWNCGMRRYMEFLVPLLKNEFSGYTVRTIWQDNKGGNQRSQVDESTCKQILEGAGFTVLDGNDNWALRKEVMKQRFEYAPGGQPAILVSRYGCPIAAEALLGGYRYPRSADGQVGSQPVKNDFSHVMDCAQMVATGEFSPMSGLAHMDEGAKKQRLLPLHDPLASNRNRQREGKYRWMTR